jgi:hypothetical protein
MGIRKIITILSVDTFACPMVKYVIIEVGGGSIMDIVGVHMKLDNCIFRDVASAQGF